MTPFCPLHGRMVLNETYKDSRFVGGLFWTGEETARVSVYVCRDGACREHREVHS